MSFPTNSAKSLWAFALLLSCNPAFAARPALFDMGTDNSPLADGFVRVTADDIYSSQRGYGFLTAGHESYVQVPIEKGPTFYMSTVGHFNRKRAVFKDRLGGVGFVAHSSTELGKSGARSKKPSISQVLGGG